jgi:hypothetical protein
MTTQNLTPVSFQVQSAFVRLAAAEVTAELALGSVIAAQRAGDADYDWCIERGLGGEMAATAYHLAYQRLARVPGGCGPVCGCNLCRDEFGVKGGAL